MLFRSISAKIIGTVTLSQWNWNKMVNPKPHMHRIHPNNKWKSLVEPKYRVSSTAHQLLRATPSLCSFCSNYYIESRKGARHRRSPSGPLSGCGRRRWCTPGSSTCPRGCSPPSRLCPAPFPATSPSAAPFRPPAQRSATEGETV